MVRDLQNVIELIDDLKATNLVNVQVLKKALLDINVRLEDISDGSEIVLVRNTLADFKEALDNKFQNVFNEIEKFKVYSVGNELSEESAELVQEKFKALFSIFDSGMNLLVGKIDSIEEDFSKLSDKSIEIAKNEFAKISQELKIHQQELIETQKLSNDGAVEKFSFVAESIKLLSENINIQTDMYKDFVTKKMAEVKEYVHANELELQNENDSVKTFIGEKFKEIEDANTEFTNDLEVIKVSIADALSRTEEVPIQTAKNLANEFRTITETANDTISEIRVLQDYSTNIIKTINKISDYTQENTNKNVIDAINELDISQNITDLFDKIESFNVNFNAKTEFLEEQMIQLKSMFSDVSIDIVNKETEIVQKEVERVKEYFERIENISKSLENLEENLKLSGIEYKEHIGKLNKELYEFISEFNSIYNEVSGSAQLEINNSLDELKQFISVNSANYSDKLVVVQEQFSNAFSELYEALKKNNQELIAGIKLESLNVEQERLLHEMDAKLDALAAVDLSNNFDEIVEQNFDSQGLIKNLHIKVDELLDTDSKEEFANRQLLANKNMVENSLKDFKTELDAGIKDITTTEICKASEVIINNVQDFVDEVVGDVSELVETSASEISQKLSTVELKSDELAKKVIDFVHGASNEVVDTVKNVSDKAIGEFADCVETATTNSTKEIISVVNETIEKSSGDILDKVFENRDVLKELNAKLDVFVSTNDTELLTDELQEIKDIILEQQQILQDSSSEDNIFISQNIEKLLERIDGISKTISEHDENTAKIKEDLVNTVVSVFSNSSFIEETEEIKDFVEEKTEEISKQLINVQSQLQTMSQPDLRDYSYTLSDVENDIAKLRQVLNDLSNSSSSSEINQISKNIYNLTSSIDLISKNLTPAEIYQLKHNILKLNDDILSISSRTNKLLLNSDEAQKTIAEGLMGFTHIAYNLEERMLELSNKELNEEMVSKMEKALMLLENASSKDETFHQAFMYLGEWIDAASDTFENINKKAEEIYEVSDALSELRKIVPEKFALIDMLEERFEEQQSRLDRLEAKIDEISDMSKMNSNFTVIQKVDKMEMLLSTLNANVEKLTSYVD